MPFYAGWGLTTDEYCCERRQRRLTISDLLYQTLISYPTYIHPESKQCISPEMAMDWLLAQKKEHGNQTRFGTVPAAAGPQVTDAA